MQTFSYVQILHDVLYILKKVDRWKWSYLKKFGKVKSKEMSPWNLEKQDNERPWESWDI
jgi:hypothetical protein